MSDTVVRAGIVGGTGYSGGELLRLLLAHPRCKIQAVSSRSRAGEPVSGLFTNLRGRIDLDFIRPQLSLLKDCDVVFFATPNGTAMTMAEALLADGVRVIDLSADFRLHDHQVWQQWYGMEHACPTLLSEAVYGLPEINRAQIRAARLVANPGCYPTAVQLGFLPLLEAGLLKPDALIADAKSGLSGAGRKAETNLLYSEIDENFSAYHVDGHRHLPEITQGLQVAAGQPVVLTFVPHLVPMVRGIHATLYGRLLEKDVDLYELYRRRFSDEPFVDVLPSGQHVETRAVRGSNDCRLAVFRPQGRDTVVVLSVIDNLIKGAAGQAVQNMNIMFGLEETMGLGAVAMLP